MFLYFIIFSKIMKTPLGTKIQGLEKILIENMKLTELVEHPHIYHGELKNPKEPLIISYKIAETYKKAGKIYDPFMKVFPLNEILEKNYPGVLQIKTKYDEQTKIHTLQLSLEHSLIEDALEFKYQVLLKINEEISKHLTNQGKKPVEV